MISHKKNMVAKLIQSLVFTAFLAVCAASPAHASIAAGSKAPPPSAGGALYLDEEIFDETFDETDTDQAVYVGGERVIAAKPGLDSQGFVLNPVVRGAIARFGPFHVVAPDRAVLNGLTDSASPEDFAKMLRLFPAIGMIEMADCPGTVDDDANLRLARMIRAAHLATFVGNRGSVRSGAVELFLAGERRIAAPRAEFAVHSWQDNAGLEADDFAADDPIHQRYLAFYVDMGLSAAQASAFYAMTNAASFDSPRWLTTAQFRQYAALN